MPKWETRNSVLFVFPLAVFHFHRNQFEWRIDCNTRRTKIQYLLLSFAYFAN